MILLGCSTNFWEVITDSEVDLLYPVAQGKPCAFFMAPNASLAPTTPYHHWRPPRRRYHSRNESSLIRAGGGVGGEGNEGGYDPVEGYDGDSGGGGASEIVIESI